MVKCVKCNHVWRHPGVTVDSEDTVPRSDNQWSGNLPALPEDVRPRRRNMVWVWPGFGLLLLLLAAIAFREPIMAQFPDTAKVYEITGLIQPPVSRSFRIESLQHSFESVGGGGRIVILEVTGLLVNLTRETATTPDIVVVLRDQSGGLLSTLSFPAPKNSLGPGKSVRFSIRISPPGTASKVEAALRTARRGSP